MKQDNFGDEMNFINAPQFPGQQLGNKSIEQIRGMIKRQKRLKGYSFNVPIGASSFNLDLSGTARILLGIALFGKSTDSTAANSWNTFTSIETLQFQVNNEIVIDQLSPNFLTQQFNNAEYYYIPRPLSGTDELTLKFINTGGNVEIVKVVLYYI
jgi:hypothetical protein